MPKPTRPPAAADRKPRKGEATARPEPLMKLALCVTPREQRRLAGVIAAHRSARPKPRS